MVAIRYIEIGANSPETWADHGFVFCLSLLFFFLYLFWCVGEQDALSV